MIAIRPRRHRRWGRPRPTSRMTEVDRSQHARIAALTRHARNDTQESTRPARAGFIARFDRLVDPDYVLSEEERQTRAKRELKAHMTRLSCKAAEARRKSK